MASDLDDLNHNIENLKSTVKTSFARVYATLKARELKTLRQLDAIRKQFEDDKDFKRNCIQNIHINYDNQATLLDHVNNFGVIDFEKLNFDSNTFTLEDYVVPEDDHMYLYKTIEELTKEDNIKDLEAIEEAALKQIISTHNCVCNVSIKLDEVSKKFRDTAISKQSFNEHLNESSQSSLDKEDCPDKIDEKSDSSDVDVKKLGPTDDWLNSIKNQTETEPSQVTDVMEQSTIACS